MADYEDDFSGSERAEAERIKREIGEGRMQPHEPEAELAVLAGILVSDGNAAMDRALAMLQPEHFYIQANRQIYDAMRRVHAAGKTVDTVNIVTELNAMGRLAQVGGAPYITDLLHKAPAVFEIAQYARTIVDRARVRLFQDVCRELLARSYQEEATDAQTFLDVAEARIHALARTSTSSKTELLSTVLARAIADLKVKAQEAQGVGATPYKRTGLHDLDSVLQNVRPGTLTIVAGRPGEGKSALALNHFAFPCALRDGEHVIFAGLEMSNEESALRTLSAQAGVEASHFDNPKQIVPYDWTKMTGFIASGAAKAKIHMLADPNLSVFELRAIARRIRSEAERCGEKLGMLVLDYLQLLRSVESKAKGREVSREQVVAGFTRSLKGLAMELQIPVVALSQLNRGGESRGGPDKRPKLSDLRESGAIEQDADNVVLIYREKKAAEGPEDKVLPTELIVAKQRRGRTGVARVGFHGDYVRFESLEQREWSQS